MKKIVLTMIYWHDGLENSTRLQNVLITWPKLKKLTVFLRENGIKCSCKLYDFSPTKQIHDSIHIPYPPKEYKKSEKLNRIIKDNLDYDFIMMYDCDMFFFEKDYGKILEILLNIDFGCVHTFDAAKLSQVDLKIVEDESVNLYDLEFSYAYSGDKNNGPLNGGLKGGLGGIYICDIKLIIDNGWFDEKHIGWGGEDGNMLGRIYDNIDKSKIFPHTDFTPFHLYHFQDWNNEKYRKRF